MTSPRSFSIVKHVTANLRRSDLVNDSSKLDSDPYAITPIEMRGGLWLKRDDLFHVASARGGKARACYLLAREAERGLVTAASRGGPQISIVARIAWHIRIKCRVHTPSGSTTPDIQDAQAHAAERVIHRPGFNSVIRARAEEDAKILGWTHIPFGMESDVAVELAARQVLNVPREAKRIVVPVGSGLTLAGILLGLKRLSSAIPVVGIVVGADPRRRLDRWAPQNWEGRVNLIRSAQAYQTPAPICDYEGLSLDPIYEAKCLPFARESDCLWIVGVRDFVKVEGLERPQ